MICPNCGRDRDCVRVSWKLGRHRALWISLELAEARRLAAAGLVRILPR